MRALPLTVLLLTASLVGCLGSETDDDDGDDAGTGQDIPAGLEGLAILHTPRSTFDSIICEPAPCLRQLTTLDEGPANEVMVQMDYTNPDRLLAGSKDYRSAVPDCALVSVYGSTDGGRTWNSGYPRDIGIAYPEAATGERCESDPVTAFDGRGNGFVITLDVSIGLFTYRTPDVGETWSEVAMAFEGGNDKNWAATDYRTGRVYSITRATCDGGEGVTYTDDSGESWEGPFCFNGMDFGQIDVGPQGQVYAVGRAAGEGIAIPGDGTSGAITFAKSLDGGETWTDAKVVAETTPMNALPVLGGHAYRTPSLPDMAVALGTGAIYAVWHAGNAGDDQDVMFVASFDEGETWTEPVEVPDSEGPTGMADQFIAAVAASPEGDAHVIWFDSRNDPSGDGNALDVYYAHNPDPEADPAGFEENIRLTELSFPPYLSKHQQQPFNIGDYVGLAASNEEAVAVFPTTINGRAEIHAVVVGGEPG